MHAADKHSSLSQAFVNYGRKKFYNIGAWFDFAGIMTIGPTSVRQMAATCFYFLFSGMCNKTNAIPYFQVYWHMNH